MKRRHDLSTTCVCKHRQNFTFILQIYTVRRVHTCMLIQQNMTASIAVKGKDEKVSDKNAHQLCIKNKLTIFNLIHPVSENMKKKFTLQSASSFLFSPGQSESVFPLSLSDSLCRGQTESPAAGRLQTIVLIPLFCSLPTCLTNTNIHTAAHLLSPQGCRHKRTELQTRAK